MARDPSQIKDDTIYTVAEASEFARLSEQTIRNHLGSGTLPGTKDGAGRWWVKGEDLKKFMGLSPEEA